MIICEFYNPVEGRPCTSYIKGGLCSLPQFYRCIEYIRRNEPTLSYSAVRDYVRCKRCYYYSNIMGIQAIEKSYPLKLGETASKILDNLHRGEENNESK